LKNLILNDFFKLTTKPRYNIRLDINDFEMIHNIDLISQEDAEKLANPHGLDYIPDRCPKFDMVAFLKAVSNSRAAEAAKATEAAKAAEVAYLEAEKAANDDYKANEETLAQENANESSDGDSEVLPQEIAIESSDDDVEADYKAKEKVEVLPQEIATDSSDFYAEADTVHFVPTVVCRNHRLYVLGKGNGCWHCRNGRCRFKWMPFEYTGSVWDVKFCRYGEDCRRKDCPFHHPGGEQRFCCKFLDVQGCSIRCANTCDQGEAVCDHCKSVEKSNLFKERKQKTALAQQAEKERRQQQSRDAKKNGGATEWNSSKKR